MMRNQRICKKFILRFTILFTFALLVILFNSLTRSSVSLIPPINVLDRRYQHTLEHIKGQRAPLQSYEVREGAIVSHADPTQCIAVNTTTLHVVLQHCTETSPETTFRLYISQEPSLKDYIKNVALNSCLDTGAALEAGVPILAYQCHGGYTQEATYDTTSKLLFHSEFNRCLDRTGVQLGGQVKLVPCDLSKAIQRWEVVDI